MATELTAEQLPRGFTNDMLQAASDIPVSGGVTFTGGPGVLLVVVTPPGEPVNLDIHNGNSSDDTPFQLSSGHMSVLSAFPPTDISIGFDITQDVLVGLFQV